MVFKDPKKLLNDYFSSNQRYKYYNPFRLAFILITATVFLYVVSGLYEKVLTMGGLQPNSTEKVGVDFIEKYASLISLLIIPFVSLGTKILFKKLNYAEHMVANFFAFAGSTVIGFLVFPLFLFIPESMLYQQSISTFTLLAFGIYFFKKGLDIKLGWAILKYIGAVCIGFIVFFLTVSIGVVAYRLGQHLFSF